jgi:hypothetical protein
VLVGVLNVLVNLFKDVDHLSAEPLYQEWPVSLVVGLQVLRNRQAVWVEHISKEVLHKRDERKVGEHASLTMALCNPFIEQGGNLPVEPVGSEEVPIL